jgi:ABC-type bacteriocin/lantibiotic exporter with double-glycine peptidase domain
MVEGAPVSSQINRLKSFEAIRDAVTGPLFVTMSELPFVGVLLFVFAMISGWLALVPATAIFIYILMFFFLQNRTRIGLVTAAGEAAEKSKIQLETFEKIDSIKYSGMSEIWFNQFREKSGRASLQNFKSSFDHSVVNILAQGIATITAISTIFFGVHMIWDGNLSTGALVASMLITWKVLSPMQSILGMLPRFEQTKFSIDQVNRLIDLETEDYHHSATLELVKFKGSIKFSNVGIRYTKEKDPVLVGLDLEIAPGELVMITGTNGTGKSTMLNLVNGLYFPQAGSIKIDGIDIRQLDPLLLRHNVAYVSQNPEFFFGTIIQNLRLAEPLALDEEIKEALFMADALDDIAKLPLGLKTIMLKDNNANNIPTSLGYKLNLARAYISRAQIYLIDELPYSLLNSKTGDNLMENLKRWRGKKTVLMVTHRNDYIKIADKAVLLANDGRHYIGYPEDIMEYIKKINTKNIRYI